MTAINVAIAPDGRRGFMLCDSAAYAPGDGILRGYADKSTVMNHSHSVVASRGPALLCQWISVKTFIYSDFDVMVEKLQKDLANSFAAIRDCSGPGSSVEFFLLGWSAREQCVKAFFAASDSSAPFALEESPLLFGPLVDVPDLRKLRLPNPSQARLDKDAWPPALLRVMQFQRERAVKQREAAVKAGWANSHAEIIGGAATLTTISKDGEITQRTIHQWNDKIGEPIKLAGVA